MQTLGNPAGARGNSRQAGISLLELLIAGMVFVVGALAVMALVSTSIATNNRNKIDSTKAMLAEAVLEQVNSTVVGSGTANISDCAGTNFIIETAAGGSKLQGSGTHPNDALGADIDYTEASPPQYYHMDYIVTSPCTSTGTYIATYDLRWHVDQVGAGTGSLTNSFLITVGAKLKGTDPGGSELSGVYFSLPVNLRVVLGRPE